MIRLLIIIFWVFVIVTLLKKLFRFAAKTEPPRNREQDRLKGVEMVQDPQCKTYIPKTRAVTKRIHGELCSFCSEACARQYEEEHRA